jgi:hypothetical protein
MIERATVGRLPGRAARDVERHRTKHARLRWPIVATAALAVAACGSSGGPSTQTAILSPSTPGNAAIETPVPTASPTPSLIPTPIPAPTVDLQAKDAGTKLATAAGSLNLTIAAFYARYNGNLDQGQYPLVAKPSKIADNVYQAQPSGTTYSSFLFVTNADGTLRSVTALSTAKLLTDEIERSFATLESLVVWSTAGIAASPGLTPEQARQVLTSLGVTPSKQFGTYAFAIDIGRVRYAIVEADTHTDLIIREAN